MSSPEDKEKHKKRIKRKVKEKKVRVRSVIAKDLLTPKYSQRVVKDKRGKKHDLETMTFRDLVEAIDE